MSSDSSEPRPFEGFSKAKLRSLSSVLHALDRDPPPTLEKVAELCGRGSNSWVVNLLRDAEGELDGASLSGRPDGKKVVRITTYAKRDFLPWLDARLRDLDSVPKLRDEGPPPERVIVGGTVTTLGLFLPIFLSYSNWLDRYGKSVELVIRQDVPDLLLDSVARGKMDLYIGPKGAKRYSARMLAPYDLPWGVIYWRQFTPSKGRSPTRTPLKPSDLRGHRLLYSRESARVADRMIQSAGLQAIHLPSQLIAILFAQRQVGPTLGHHLHVLGTGLHWRPLELNDGFPNPTHRLAVWVPRSEKKVLSEPAAELVKEIVALLESKGPFLG